MRSPGRTPALVVLLLALVPAGAAADEAAGEAAARLSALQEKGDDEGFRREARGLKTDPWLVVEALFETGAEAAARALAGLVSGDMGSPALAEYAAWRGEHPPPADAVQRLQEA